VLQLKPDDLEAWRGLGRAYLALGDAEGSAAVVEKLRSSSPAMADELAQEVARAALRQKADEPGATVSRRRSRGKAAKARSALRTAKLATTAAETTSGFDVWLRTLQRPAASAPAPAPA
jgi:hypothetical protein